jgi:uncharacterized protein YuzE
MQRRAPRREVSRARGILNVVTNRAKNLIINHRRAIEGNYLQKPISLDIDFKANAGYLEYRSLGYGQLVTRTQRVHDAVHVDFDAESQIFGIELLGFDNEALGAARHFAEQHDLEFPELLTRTGPHSGLTSVETAA